MNGSIVKVPLGKSWKVKNVSIGCGDGYNILISKNIFNEIYNESDTIKFPFYVSELEMINCVGGFYFTLKIQESANISKIKSQKFKN